MITRQNIKTNFRDIKTSLFIKVNGMPVKISRRTFEISKTNIPKNGYPINSLPLKYHYQLMRKKTSHYHIMITRQNIKTNFQDKKASLLIKVNGTSVKISKQTYEISKRILDHQLAES